MMAYAKYVLRNVTRNRLRSVLTVLSLAVCMCLMSFLYGYILMQDQFSPVLARGNRLLIMSKQGFSGRMPLAYVRQIRAMPGIVAAVPYTWYLGQYKDRRTLLDQIGTDAKWVFAVWDECQLEPDQLQAWLDDRQGCVVDQTTARRFGWQIGERIPLRGDNYNYNLELTLRGIFQAPDWLQQLFFHNEYLDEGLRQQDDSAAGTTSFIFAKAESAAAVARLCEAIDQRFASSNAPTWTQSHQEFMKTFSKFLGNIQAYIRNIGLAVVFALTLVAGTTMAMSVRERTSEIAVLKALGFRPGVVLGMILSESILVAVVGGVLGMSLAQLSWFVLHQVYPQFVPIDHIAWILVPYGLAVATMIGVLSGIVPAVRSARLSVIDGLRKVG